MYTMSGRAFRGCIRDGTAYENVYIIASMLVAAAVVVVVYSMSRREVDRRSETEHENSNFMKVPVCTFWNTFRNVIDSDTTIDADQILFFGGYA